MKEKIEEILRKYIRADVEDKVGCAEFLNRELVKELSTLIQEERKSAKEEARMELEVEVGLKTFGQLMKEKNKIWKEAYLKGVDDFCTWNVSNADGGYVQDKENFLASEEYLESEK